MASLGLNGLTFQVMPQYVKYLNVIIAVLSDDLAPNGS